MSVGAGIVLGLVGIATSVTSGIISSISSYNEAQEQAEYTAENARLQQQQAEYNQRMELLEAAAEERETMANALDEREEAKKLLATQRALLGKSGAALTSGSPLAILGATAADEEENIRDIHYTGAREAAAHYSKAADYGYTAAIAKHNILSAEASSPTGTSLISSIAGNVGSGLFSAGSLSLSGASASSKTSK